MNTITPAPLASTAPVQHAAQPAEHVISMPESPGPDSTPVPARTRAREAFEQELTGMRERRRNTLTKASNVLIGAGLAATSLGIAVDVDSIKKLAAGKDTTGETVLMAGLMFAGFAAATLGLATHPVSARDRAINASEAPEVHDRLMDNVQ